VRKTPRKGASRCTQKGDTIPLKGVNAPQFALLVKSDVGRTVLIKEGPVGRRVRPKERPPPANGFRGGGNYIRVQSGLEAKHQQTWRGKLAERRNESMKLLVCMQRVSSKDKRERPKSGKGFRAARIQTFEGQKGLEPKTGC